MSKLVSLEGRISNRELRFGSGSDPDMPMKGEIFLKSRSQIILIRQILGID